MHMVQASFILSKMMGVMGSVDTPPINNHTIINNNAIIRVRNNTGCPMGLGSGKDWRYVVGNISGFTPALSDLVAEGDGLNHPFQGARQGQAG